MKRPWDTVNSNDLLPRELLKTAKGPVKNEGEERIGDEMLRGG